MDSHTISALNRLEVVETGRRRRWSEEEKARIVLESLSEPRLVAATGMPRVDANCRKIDPTKFMP
ncbi:transposase-like protein [Bradyrhizobium diazoefficiens]